MKIQTFLFLMKAQVIRLEGLKENKKVYCASNENLAFSANLPDIYLLAEFYPKVWFKEINLKN